MQGSNGAGAWSGDFIGDRFPFACGSVNAHIKSLCRPQRFVHSHAHYPEAIGNVAYAFHAASGGDHEPSVSPPERALSAVPNADFAWINHYHYKSTEEFIWKWSRGRGDMGRVAQRSNKMLSAHVVRDFVRQFETRQPVQASLAQCAPAMASELDILLGLPGVAAAQERVRSIYAEQIRMLVPMFTDAPGVLEAGEAGEVFLATLGLRR